MLLKQRDRNRNHTALDQPPCGRYCCDVRLRGSGNKAMRRTMRRIEKQRWIKRINTEY